MRSEPETQADGAKGMVIAPLALKLACANDVSEGQAYALIHQSEAALNLTDEGFPLHTVACAPGVAWIDILEVLRLVSSMPLAPFFRPRSWLSPTTVAQLRPITPPIQRYP